MLAILSTGLPFGVSLARKYLAHSFETAGHSYGSRYAVRFYPDRNVLQIYRDAYYWIALPFEDVLQFSIGIALLAWLAVACIEVAARIAEMRKRRAIGFDVLASPQTSAAPPAGNGAPQDLESGYR